ncbi:MAG: chemotaxis protein CheW [Novosphingobium sp.]|nr:chemotaxis protein CheW [Novosphingobium sp.]MCP5379311.1 chemotaxis protein CheW [Novosphingobium sp.]MCP5388375.1 chemotaxis protein CheW [Novosphingobium sp.]
MILTIVVATIAGSEVALPADRIDCVIELGALTPVPRAPAAIAGLATLRSRVLTVIDTSVALGLAPDRTSSGGTGGKAVVIRHGGHDYALCVDAVRDVKQAAGEVEPLSVPVGDGWQRVARGMIATGASHLLLIDPDKLIKMQELEMIT